MSRNAAPSALDSFGDSRVSGKYARHGVSRSESCEVARNRKPA